MSSSILLLLVATAVGCRKEPEITKYEVPRESALPADLDDAPAVAETRMIAAIVPGEQEAWFIKATGPEANIEAVADDIHQFIKDVQLAEDNPDQLEWEVPESWTTDGPRAMREATLIVPGSDPPLEVAISKLGYDGDREPYLLANINRWRGQLGLDPVDQVDTDAEVETIDLASGTAWVLDAVGTMDLGGMRPPMMGGRAPFAPQATAPPRAPSVAPEATAAQAKVNSRPELKFTPPDDWQELPRGSMGSRSYQMGEGNTAAVVKLSDFPPVGMMADPLTNINRWRGQLSAGALTKDQLPKETEAVSIAGTDGVLTDITSPDDAKAMLAAMIEAKGQVWFFQLLGSPEAVKTHREEFVDWLGTVEITGGGEAAEPDDSTRAETTTDGPTSDAKEDTSEKADSGDAEPDESGPAEEDTVKENTAEEDYSEGGA